MQVNIKSKDLLEKIEFELGKNVIEKLDLNNVKSIVLNGTKLNGEKTDIEIKEVSKLENLESLIILNFVLKDDDIKAINKLEKLKALQFENCDFSKVKQKIKAPIEILALVTCTNYKIDKICNKEKIKSVKIYE